LDKTGPKNGQNSGIHGILNPGINGTGEKISLRPLEFPAKALGQTARKKSEEVPFPRIGERGLLHGRFISTQNFPGD